MTDQPDFPFDESELSPHWVAPTDRINDPRVGYLVWLCREDWGHVIDGLILGKADAERRQAANSESTSGARAGDIGKLISRLNLEDPLGAAGSAVTE